MGRDHEDVHFLRAERHADPVHRVLDPADLRAADQKFLSEIKESVDDLLSLLHRAPPGKKSPGRKPGLTSFSGFVIIIQHPLEN